MRVTTFRSAVAGAVGVVLVTALTGCGSHGDTAAAGGYCQELKTDKAYFRSLDGDHPDLTRLDDMFGRLQALAADAPAGVASDWRTVDSTVTTIEAALDDAGLEPDDLARMQQGHLPEGADLDKVAALVPTLQALSGTRVNEAADHIAHDAEVSCGLDLQAG
jgi:hypothetical protein